MPRYRFPILFILLFVFIFLWIFVPRNPPDWNNLKRDGAQLFSSAIPAEKIKKWRNLCETKRYKELKADMQSDEHIQRVVKNVAKDHVLQDYIWVIEKSAVHTCHRDNNGTFFNKGQKHPSYTMLVYLENMEKCLGVIPGSHTSQYKNAIHLGGVDDILCSAGDIIVFDANLVHVGTFAERDDNLRIQMKISHPDDLEVLKYYQNYNKVLNKENTNPFIVRKLQKELTCAFPIVSDLTQFDNIKSARGSVEGAEISTGQKIFSWLFYGRKDFYDLPNAF